jgi:hypothetical protein
LWSYISAREVARSASLSPPPFCPSLRAGSPKRQNFETSGLLPSQDSAPSAARLHLASCCHTAPLSATESPPTALPCPHPAPMRCHAHRPFRPGESPTLQPRRTPKILDLLRRRREMAGGRRRPPTRRVGGERGEMDFAGMKRWDLQALCKEHGLPAGGTNAALVARLAACSALQVRCTGLRGNGLGCGFI